MVVEIGTKSPGYENSFPTGQPFNLDLRQPKVKETLDFTDRFLLITLFPPLNSQVVGAQWIFVEWMNTWISKWTILVTGSFIFSKLWWNMWVFIVG